MASGQVLLIEDDRWIADVLEQIVGAAAPGCRVDCHADVATATKAFDNGHYDLVICDWNLPGQPGIDLVAHVRAQASQVPVIMVTGRSDRGSVIAARSHGADAFIVKPFQVERVLATIQRYLAGVATVPAVPPPAQPENALAYLAALTDDALELTGLQGLRQGIDMLAEDDAPDLRELARQWEQEPALCARLISMANSSLYNPHGRIGTHVGEALARLGWRTGVNVATAMAMRRATQLKDPRLSARAQRQQQLTEDVSDRVHELAHRARIDPSACHTAALLHRLGEMTVVLHLQDYQDRFGAIADEATLDTAIDRFARPFADRLKSQWRLPTQVRELIGAIYALPPGTSQPEKYLLRVAGHRVYRDLSDEEAARLQRLAGV